MNHLRRFLIRLLPVLASPALLLAACSRPMPLQTVSGPSSVEIVSGPTDHRMDPAEILEARILGDELNLQVRYGGGCREHHFSLLHSGIFMESLPVQADLQLTHDADGDLCRALLSRSLVFDLSPVKHAYQRAYHTRNGVIVLHLYAPAAAHPQRPPLRYEF